MWIKEIRFYFSVFGYQVKNLKGNMDLKAGLSRFRTTLYDYLSPTGRLHCSFSSLDIGVSWVEFSAFFVRELIFNSSTIVAFWDMGWKVQFQN